MTHKPEGYTSVSPYLIVKNAEATHEFITTVFEGETLRVFRRDDGSIVHSEARIDDSVVMIAQENSDVSVHIHVYVPDSEKTFARAVEAGATVVDPIALKDDGDRRGGVRDENGTIWWISTQVGKPS